MKPRRTHMSNFVYRLDGGTEDNDLWSQIDRGAGTVSSVWELDTHERAAVAAGANVQLTVWGGQPPVAMQIVTTPLGKAPEEQPPA